MKSNDNTKGVWVDCGELWLRGESEERAGKLCEVLCVRLSGHEDGDWWESGSSRIYAGVEANHGELIYIPLLVSATNLSSTGKALGAAAGCRYRQEDGISGLPKRTSSRR